MSLETIELAQRLIRLPSETSSENSQVTEAIADVLSELDFEVVSFPYVDRHQIKKVAIAARRCPVELPSQPDNQQAEKPGMGFFCHSDVVSVEGWSCEHGGPWDAAIADGKLWGRGACDMKGPMAAALAAISRVDRAEQSQTIYFFVTGDEESGMAGADLLSRESSFLDDLVGAGGLGIICEPTLLETVNAHKGGCHIVVTSNGVAAHSSSLDGVNANRALIPFLGVLESILQRSETESEFQNMDFHPPTLSLNIVIENEPAMPNITVGKACCRIFMRPMPGTAWQKLADEIQAEARRLGLDAACHPPLLPLHTDAKRPSVQRVLARLKQAEPIAVSYATDGCCFGKLKDLLVLGPGSIDQAHRPDEWIELSQLELGQTAYASLLNEFAC